MHDFQIKMPSEYKTMPWKNGLGNTLEIQRCEDQQGLRFRLSQASVVEDGLFSDFTGLHRSLVLLSGNGLTLTHQNRNQSQQMDKPLAIALFSGSDTTVATLTDGAIEDLNIMVRDTDTQANVRAIDTEKRFSFSHTEQSLYSAFYAHRACTINLNENTLDQQTIHLCAGSLLHSNKCQDKQIQSSQIKRDALLITGSGVFIEILTK